MAQAVRSEPHAVEAASDRFGVLVGWSHSPCGEGINLRVQSAESRAALSAGRVDTSHLLMTRNQALLLARYLLESTGQALDPADRPHRWRTAWSRVRGR